MGKLDLSRIRNTRSRDSVPKAETPATSSSNFDVTNLSQFRPPEGLFAKSSSAKSPPAMPPLPLPPPPRAPEKPPPPPAPPEITAEQHQKNIVLANTYLEQFPEKLEKYASRKPDKMKPQDLASFIETVRYEVTTTNRLEAVGDFVKPALGMYEKVLASQGIRAQGVSMLAESPDFMDTVKATVLKFFGDSAILHVEPERKLLWLLLTATFAAHTSSGGSNTSAPGAPPVAAGTLLDPSVNTPAAPAPAPPAPTTYDMRISEEMPRSIARDLGIAVPDKKESAPAETDELISALERVNAEYNDL